MKWQPFRSVRNPARPRARRRRPVLCLEPLETRLVPSTNVTGYHQASPVPSPASSVGAGVNTNETLLTPANVNATSFGKLFSATVDGQVYAEPLYVENVNVTTGSAQGAHNVVFVATQHDSLYAIDANSGAVLWHDALLTAEHGGSVSSVPSGAVNSGDISPEIGVTATPVIDPATDTIFVEAKEQEVAGDGTHFEHLLYAVNLGSGAVSNKVLIADSVGDTVVSGPAVTGTGDGSAGGVVKFDALRQMDRPAVTLVNGNLYLAFASHGDNGPYHGWVLGYSESSLAPTAVFNADPNGGDDGIWQSGGAIAYETVNGNTYLYVETGNGSFDTTLAQSPFNPGLMIPARGDYGDTFLKLQVDGSKPASGSLDATNNANGWGLHVADYFTPQNEGNLSGGDTDLGSGAPLLLPASAGSAAHPNLMVGGGKEGRLYLIDRNNMGGYHGDAAGDGNSGTDDVVQETVAGAVNGILDTPTYYNGTLYIAGGYGDPARTFSISDGVMSSTSVTQSTDSYPFPGSTATISTNPQGGNAVVWDVAGPGTSELRAYSAGSGYATEIYTSSQAANSRDALGSATKFVVPTVADGEVFVGTANSLVAYGLLQRATAAPAAPTNLTATAISGSVINLNWTDNDTSPNTATGYNVLESASANGPFATVGTASAGATSFAVGGLQKSTTYFFKVDAFNAVGTSAATNVASATTTSQAGALDFSTGFAGSGGVLTFNGNAKINGTSAELTDGGANEAASFFSTNTVDVTSFSTQFSFQQTSANGDGFTFTIQGEAPTARGPSGGGLGYGPDTPGGTPGIGKSVAVKFDLFNNAGEGSDSTGEYTDGASPTVPAIDLTNSGIDLHSGDVFNVALSYNGSTLGVTITDTKTNASASQSYSVNIPQVIGSATGYVGFTGGTGGSTAVQNILTWDYSPTATSLPAAPSGLTGTVISGSEVDLSWTNNANNASAVLVYRSSDGVNFTHIASVGATVAAYHDTSLSPGNTYFYEVQATNAAGSSSFSNVFEAATLTPPAPPTNLTATNITTTEVDLSWTNVATNATGIKILKQLGSNSSQVVASGLSPTTTSYAIKGLTPGSPYLFEVDALNSNGPSGAATISVDTVSAPVTGVTAASHPGKIVVAWNSDPGAVSYNVYRALTPGGEGATPTWKGVAGTSFSDSTVLPGVTYYYKVTAVDANSASASNPAGESAKSAEVSADPTLSPPPAPTGLTATAGNNRVALAWTAVSGATSYNVFRGTKSGQETLLASGVTTTSFTDTGAQNGVPFFYFVTTVDANLAPMITQSGPSNEVSVTPPSAPVLSPIPNQTVSHNQPSFQVTLNATDPGHTVTFSATVSADNPLFDLDRLYQFSPGGYATAGATAYVLSTGTINSFGNNFYLVSPQGNLYAYDGSGSYLHTFNNVTPIAQVGVAVFATPSLLFAAQPPSGPPPAVGLSISGNTLTVTPPTGFIGSFKVTVSATDGVGTATQQFLANIVDNPPVLSPIANQSVAFNQFPLQIGLSATDADNDPITFSAQVLGSSAAFNLEQQFLFQPIGYQTAGQTAFVLHSNQPGPGVGGFYLIRADGAFFAYDGSPTYWLTFTKNSPMAQLGAPVFQNPSLLLNAQAPINYTLYSQLMTQFQFRGEGYFTAGETVFVLQSSQPGPGVGGFYLLRTDGSLYAYDGSATYTQTFAKTKPLATLDPRVYFNPSLLLNAIFSPAVYTQMFNLEQQFQFQPVGFQTAGTTAFVLRSS